MPLDVTVRITPPLQQQGSAREPLRPRRDLTAIEQDEPVQPRQSARVQQALQHGVLRVRDLLEGKGVSEGELEVQLHAVRDGADVHLELDTHDRHYVTDGGDTDLPKAIRDGFDELVARIDQNPPLPSTDDGDLTWTVLRGTARRHAVHEIAQRVDAGELPAGHLQAADLADRAMERVIAERYPDVAIDDALPRADAAETLKAVLLAIDAQLLLKDDGQATESAILERERPDTEADAAAAEERRRLTRALFALEPDDRALFAHAIIDGLPFSLVAAVREIDEETVEDRLVDILDTLGESLGLPGTSLLDRYARLGRTLRGEERVEPQA